MQLENIVFSYPARPGVRVMNGVSLAVSEGRTVALVGPSGFGKSTVMSLILRFYNAQRGDIFMDELSVKQVKFMTKYYVINLISQHCIYHQTAQCLLVEVPD